MTENAVAEQMRNSSKELLRLAKQYRRWAAKGGRNAAYYASEAERLEGQSEFFSQWAERSVEHA